MNTENPYAPPRAAVSDVTSGADELEPASRGTRLGAAIIDGIIGVICIYVPLIAGGWLQNPSAGGVFQVGTVWIAIMVVLSVAWLGVTIVLVSRNGQTIGKKALGIKVVRSDGSKASLGRIFWLRNFVNGLLGLIPLYGLVDVLFIFGEQRQCVHDKIADTIVVVA